MTPSLQNVASEPPVHGLVVLNNLANNPSGMNKTLKLAAPYLARHNLFLHFIATPSLPRVLRHVARVVLKERKSLRFDFVLFNGLSALGSRGGYFVAGLLRLLKLPFIIYWHEMGMIFDELAVTQPEAIRRVDAIVNVSGAHHLAASQASADAMARRYPALAPFSPFTKQPRSRRRSTSWRCQRQTRQR